MIQQLGVMLSKERDKLRETQKRIAEGIISVPELCRLEHGGHEIDYFTLQALFERMGKSIDKLELAVSSSEYESVAYRIEIERSIEDWDYQKLKKLLSRYGDYNDEKRPIHNQYRMAMEAMACYLRRRDYASCLKRMEQALACTLQGDWMHKVRNGECLCNQEIRIIMVITYCQWKLGNTDGLSENMEQLGRYILYHYTDTEEQVKVYPHCAWLHGQLCLDKNRVEEAYAVCGKGKASLLENGSLSPLWQILELEEACLEKLGKQPELLQCRKYQEAVAFLYEAAGKRPESDMMPVFMKSSFQGEFIITNELVRDLRAAMGFSQEYLCAGICSCETLSRIENGKRSPNKKKLYQLLRKMGMERENYYGFIEADDYELYEKVRQYKRCFPKGRREEAMKLLDEIENGVDMTKTVNRQFVGNARISQQLVQNEVSQEQANQKFQELLYLTMPPVDSGKMIYRVPFRTEYTICNKIANNLWENNKIEEALRIYEQLMQCYEKSKVSMRYHAVPGLTLYINYAGILEERNELKEAIAVGKEGLNHSLECCRGDMTGDILANLSLVYGKQGLPDVEEKYLRYGYYLVELYDSKNMMDVLRNAYQDKFHREID